ncbi:DUF4251 domain-containing protein [Mangrovibacterium lignilyticum]|uniref:DUF4251 domain-containing protein n=1 Tax=Mangrovibacterium lignilyticum TaxID=2668052 RepID=UPI0013D5B74E|nr:DUF4251 domain-containing protein [Mangrovibacterium lignilyticum]
MKSAFLISMILGTCLIANSVDAQNSDKQAKKQAKKEQKALLQQQNMIAVTQAIDSLTFVVEADRLQSKAGRTINVSSNLNFIAVDHESAFIQIGSNAAIGSNGVGGVSVDSKVTKIDIDKNEKRGSYLIRMTCMSSAGIFDISISSNSDGQAVSATIGGNWGGKLTYQGKLVPLKQSTVYKGSPRY